VYDVDIRRALHVEVEQIHRDDPDTRIIDELGLRQGEVRIDVAVVNGVLKGYEIKSVADTLRRLPSQIRVYSEVLDYATIVLSESHCAGALELVPLWWEVLVANDGGDRVQLGTLRRGDLNPSINKRALAELLWHSDAIALLRRKGAYRGLARKPRSEAWDRIAEVCTLDEVREAVRRQLKGRQARRSAS
jgi:hypothetical protein